MYADSVFLSNALSVRYLGDNPPVNELRETVLNPALPEITGKHVEFAIRFRQALQYAGLMGFDPKKQKKFGSYVKAAEKLPFKSVMTGEIYRGEKLPEQDKYVQIAKATRVNYIWLRDGIGDMASGRDYNSIISELPPGIKDAIDAILDRYT